MGESVTGWSSLRFGLPRLVPLLLSSSVGVIVIAADEGGAARQTYAHLSLLAPHRAMRVSFFLFPISCRET